MGGPHDLGRLLLVTLDDFMGFLEQRHLSEEYRTSARRIIRQFAGFCGTGVPSDDSSPWQVRQHYLDSRGELRAAEPFSSHYLKDHGRQLRFFISWFVGQRQDKQRETRPADGASEPCWQELLSVYQAARGRRSPGVQRLLSKHLPALVQRIGATVKEGSAGEPVDVEHLLNAHFEQRRLALRNQGYGMVMQNRARVVTRRYLLWLERQRHLVAGTARSWASQTAASQKDDAATLAAEVRRQHLELDAALPVGLREPLGHYLDYLTNHRQLSPGRQRDIRRCLVHMCRSLAEKGLVSFGAMHIQQVDQVVSELVTAPDGDLLRRRQQVRMRHSELRPFLRYLHQQGLISVALDKALIAPPCYRASRPPQALSPGQLCNLLQSVDLGSARGQLVYPILVLMATYGLRPSDVAALTLDDIHWRQQTLSLVQRKTGTALMLPLLEQVARAFWVYLRQSRALQGARRELFLTPRWPHRPLSADGVAHRVKEALCDAGFERYSARHLRHSVAVGLLRQGEGLSIIGEILGHLCPETTQRYAVTDPLILRRVLDEKER